MTYAELEKEITAVLQEPDSALVNIKPILEKVKTDYEGIITLSEKNAKNEARIRDLQDTNMKLFLAQTGQVKDKETEDDDDELTGMDAVDAFVAKLNKED